MLKNLLFYWFVNRNIQKKGVQRFATKAVRNLQHLKLYPQNNSVMWLHDKERTSIFNYVITNISIILLPQVTASTLQTNRNHVSSRHYISIYYIFLET